MEEKDENDHLVINNNNNNNNNNNVLLGPSSKSWNDTLIILFYGQCLSLLIAGTGIFSTLLQRQDVSIPGIQAFTTYLPLFLYFYLYKLYKNKYDINSYKNLKNNINNININNEYNELNDTLEYEKNRLMNNNDEIPLWKYIIISFIDLEANYLFVLAYHYTSLTSVMLLDCFTIAWAMFFSKIFLNRKYIWKHYIGAFICVIGLIGIIFSDLFQNDNNNNNDDTNNDKNDDDNDDPSHPIWGDIICIAATSLYGLSNVYEEKLVKDDKRDEFLGYLGLFGSIFSFIQMWIIEYDDILNIGNWNIYIWIYLLCYSLCMYLLYLYISIFLIKNDAAFFNLSLLTSDVYAILFSWLVLNSYLNSLYFLSFSTVIIGLIIYHHKPFLFLKPTLS